MPNIPSGYDYASCRGVLRHAWQSEVEVLDVLDLSDSRFHIQLRCMRCDTVRRDTLHHGTAELLSRSYEYPPSYKITTKVKPKLTDFRAKWIHDALKGARR